MPGSDDRARRLDQFLATMLDTGQTIDEATRHTIEPPKRGTASERALAVLNKLAENSGGAAGQIEMGETLAEGGMGVVKLATQVALGRTVAVKTLREDQPDEATMLLLREAWITGALEHPNVVPVYDVGVDEAGKPVIVLKRIEGVEWWDLMDEPKQVRERFGIDDLLDWNLEILNQVCNAVRFAHSRGILHRDLKPENVMIGEFGEVYVVDWGIAVSLRDDGSGRMPLAEDAIDMAGTPCYMAPEMLGGGEVPLSERTDIYLLGSMLYEILAGEPPHDGDSAIEVVRKVRESNPPMPDDAPARLVEICRRAMDPDPTGRFERVEQLQLALQGYRQHRGSERLAEQAERSLAELEAVLARDSVDRHEVYRLFGSCRFGFREALNVWSRNDRARDGLQRAVRTMVEYELSHGDPSAADALLAEDPDAPDELRARVHDALAATRAERAELERLRDDMSPVIGSRTRWFLAGVLGLMWTVFPLLEYLFESTVMAMNHGALAAGTGGFAGVCGLLWLWARESLSKTAINRNMSLAVAFMFFSQIVLALGSWLADIDRETTQLLLLFLWMTITGMAFVGIERRMWPAVLVYVAAFFVAARWIDLRFLLMSLANLGLMINMLVIWWPRRANYPKGVFVR